VAFLSNGDLRAGIDLNREAAILMLSLGFIEENHELLRVRCGTTSDTHSLLVTTVYDKCIIIAP
jgi:hypothetical protein